MTEVHIIWEVTEEPDSTVQYIAAYGITVEEVEEVLLDRDSEDTTSRSSGWPSTSLWCMLMGAANGCVCARLHGDIHASVA